MGMGFFWNGGFEIMFFLVFALVFGTFIFAFIKGMKTWNKNNHSPRLTVESQVVSKRMDVSHHHHGNTADHNTYNTSLTWYYVTFQGTRYLGFVRK